LRQRLNVSQAVFAGLLNVPKVTAISWEKGRRQPTGAALRLLDLVREKGSTHRMVHFSRGMISLYPSFSNESRCGLRRLKRPAMALT
jgi:transcriptional regulator with XRE-family HTH domain